MQPLAVGDVGAGRVSEARIKAAPTCLLRGRGKGVLVGSVRAWWGAASRR